jgi:hypothetical protein
MPVAPPTPAPMPALPPAPVFETAIPTDLLPPLAGYEIPPVSDSEGMVDTALWADADGIEAAPLSGEAVVEFEPDWLETAIEPTAATAAIGELGAPADATAPPADAAAGEGPAPAATADDPAARWAAVRDANIRPYVDWRPTGPLTLPVMLAPARPQHGGGHQGQQAHQAGGRPRHPGFNSGGGGPANGSGGGGRKRRRGRNRGGRDFQQQHHHRRDRDRGPRLPGFYNPGGD